MKIYPYVYMLTHKVTGEFYIGYRSANKVPAVDDLGKFYYTSSKQIKPIFNEFECIVLAEFFHADDAYVFEQQLIFEHWHDPLMLNGNCQVGGKLMQSRPHRPRRPHSEEAKRKMSASAKNRDKTPYLGRKHTDESKVKISNAHKGKIHTQEHIAKATAHRKGSKHTQQAKDRVSEARKINRVCRIKDRREMDVANYHRYLASKPHLF